MILLSYKAVNRKDRQVPLDFVKKKTDKYLSFTQLILELYTPGIPDSRWAHVIYDSANLKK